VDALIRVNLSGLSPMISPSSGWSTSGSTWAQTNLRLMDAVVAVASKREVREYADRQLPEELKRSILDAGRVAGSSKNRQQWRFVALETREALERAARTVFAQDNVRRAPFAVVVAVHGKGPTTFDAGRAAQNMMLAAWDLGVGSCPNGMPDRAAAAEILGLREGEVPAIIVSFGYPAVAGRDPASRSAEEWVAAADRKPFDEVVERR
jgi:nitroreductase